MSSFTGTTLIGIGHDVLPCPHRRPVHEPRRAPRRRRRHLLRPAAARVSRVGGRRQPRLPAAAPAGRAASLCRIRTLIPASSRGHLRRVSPPFFPAPAGPAPPPRTLIARRREGAA